MFPSRILLYLVNFVFGFIAFILGLRIVLRLFGASSSAPFVRWVYDTSDALIAPFRGMFPSPVVNGGFVIEVNTLIALLFYAFLGYIIGEIIAFVQYSATNHYRRIH